MQSYKERLETARKSERKWHRTLKFNGLCGSFSHAIRISSVVDFILDKVARSLPAIFDAHNILVTIINVQMEGDNKMVKEKQEVVHKARRQSQVNLITFDCLLFFIINRKVIF